MKTNMKRLGRVNGVSAWNPRYVNYCRVNGVADPKKMIERDRELWPGGVMCGFTLWIGEKWTAWEKETGWGHEWPKGDEQYENFDAWLDKVNR